LIPDVEMQVPVGSAKKEVTLSHVVSRKKL
jgi:hypothetical protein